MLSIQSSHQVSEMIISFQRGEYVLEQLSEFLIDQDINTGLILSGIGSFDICNLSTIVSTAVPPEPTRKMKLNGPIEIGSLQGNIAAGEAHIHTVVHDVADDQVYVGHLEPGSRCCYRVELGLISFEDVRTERFTDLDTKLIDIKLKSK